MPAWIFGGHRDIPKARESLMLLEGYWRTGVQAGPESPMEKFLLAKNPTNFILQ